MSKSSVEDKEALVPVMSHVEKPVKDQIEALAKKEQRTLSNMAAVLLRRGLAQVAA